MAYYDQTHKQEKIQTPELFRINKITYEEKIENLMILILTWHSFDSQLA